VEFCDTPSAAAAGGVPPPDSLSVDSDSSWSESAGRGRLLCPLSIFDVALRLLDVGVVVFFFEGVAVVLVAACNRAPITDVGNRIDVGLLRGERDG
jgi:hypothetical protein